MSALNLSLRAVAVAVTAMVSAIAIQAQQITPEAALSRIYTEPPAKAEWFDPTFVAQVPTARVDDLVKQFTAEYGKFVRTDKAGDGYDVRLERATVPAKIFLNDSGRIIELWFGMPVPTQSKGLEEALQAWAKLPGKTSVNVTENGRAIGALNAVEPLAVGSTLKLAILATLQDQIAQGKHRWDEVVKLRKEWKSLPSGVLHTWPDDSPLTIATLANEMISISDNTATDVLLNVVGRENVEKYAPRSKPFLSTREAFLLKGKANEDALRKYRSADESGRRALLKEVDAKTLPTISDLGFNSHATDVEWFFTTSELCTLMDKVADLPAMQINDGGLVRKGDWKQVSFKGGSEPGVLNLTMGLVGIEGHKFCVSATWNYGQDADEKQMKQVYQDFGSILAALHTLSEGQQQKAK